MVEGQTVVETVVVEREVIKEVEKEVAVEIVKEVEKIVIASPTPAPETFYGLPIPEANPTISEPPGTADRC